MLKTQVCQRGADSQVTTADTEQTRARDGGDPAPTPGATAMVTAHGATHCGRAAPEKPCDAGRRRLHCHVVPINHLHCTFPKFPDSKATLQVLSPYIPYSQVPPGISSLLSTHRLSTPFGKGRQCPCQQQRAWKPCLEVICHLPKL